MTLPWPPAEAARLEALVESGHVDDDIATILGRSKASVTCKRARMGLDSPRGRGMPRRYDWQAIIAALDAGENRREIAERLGASVETVDRVARL